MFLPSTLLALALVSLPHVVEAHVGSVDRVGAAVVAPLAAPVRLTHRGRHREFHHTFLRGLSVVDRQDVDVDGDGDRDALVLLDLDPSEQEPKSVLGRGVVVVFRERRGWRARTVASVPRVPFEAGYNWGRVEMLRPGVPPLLHVMYSQALPTGFRQADTVVQYHRGTLRVVYSRAVESVPGEGSGAVTRSLSVQTADVDGDGVYELVERVAEHSRCSEGGCTDVTGTTAITRRVLRWDPSRNVFVDAPALGERLREAVHLLDEAQRRWQAGDLEGRDAAIVRAYGIDPLDARVRMAYARLLLRRRAYASALEVLEFAWPQGELLRDALTLRAEAAAHAGDVRCRGYLTALEAFVPERRTALIARLEPLAISCREGSTK